MICRTSRKQLLDITCGLFLLVLFNYSFVPQLERVILERVWVVSDAYGCRLQFVLTVCRKEIVLLLPLAASKPELVFPNSSTGPYRLEGTTLSDRLATSRTASPHTDKIHRTKNPESICLVHPINSRVIQPLQVRICLSQTL